MGPNAEADRDAVQIDEHAGDQLWPMGAVSRYTGISEHTLRAWERRFKFPKPKRLASGHRRYTTSQVRQLMLINSLLSAGYRAGDVVPLPREQLDALLEQRGLATDEADSRSRDQWCRSIFELALGLDRPAIAEVLHQEAALLGVPGLLRERVGPLLTSLGLEWARGKIDVRHEHLITEALEDLLRSIRMPLEAGGRGRPVVLAGLEGELHGLGLQLAAISVVLAGRSLRLLGPSLPVQQIASAAATADAVAVGLSISPFAQQSRTVRQVTELRERLPAEVRLWLGGAGAASLGAYPAGVTVIETLDDLDEELARLPMDAVAND